MEKKNVKFAKADVIAIERLSEQLASELNVDEDLGLNVDPVDVDPVGDGTGEEDNDIIAIAEELLTGADLPDDKSVVSDGGDDDARKVLADANALEKQLNEGGNGTCPNCGGKGCSTCASEFTASDIALSIGDEANGGDPSVSKLPDTKIDCDTYDEVFGQNTDSEYVAKITARLDRVASALEARGMKQMAFRVDQLSDRLEASIR